MKTKFIYFLTAYTFVIFNSHSFAGTIKKNFRVVENDMSRQDIEYILGEPEKVIHEIVPEQPFYGPQEILISVLKPSDPYEEWIYTDNEKIYLVWFGSSSDESKDKWKVVATFSYPKDVVF